MATWTMPMDQVLNLISCETDEPMRETIESGHCDWDIAGSDFYAKISDRMAEDKINAVPILVALDGHGSSDSSYLYNGHHRVTLAYRLGLREMLCTDDDDASGFSPDLAYKVILCTDSRQAP